MSKLVSVEFIATAVIEVDDAEDEDELEKGILGVLVGDVFLNEILTTGQLEVVLG